MLQTTLSTEFIPGTNLKGRVTGANWSFLLPNLELDQVVALGLPPVSTLQMLGSIAERVIVACHSSKQFAAAEDFIAEGDRSADVRAIYAPVHDELGIARSSTDLVLLADRRSVQRLGNDEYCQTLREWLTADGLVYCEWHGARGPRLSRSARKRIDSCFGAAVSCWLTPLGGEMHTAVPLHDCKTMEYFLDQGMISPTVTQAGLVGGLRRLRRSDQQATPSAAAHKTRNSHSATGLDNGKPASQNSTVARLQATVKRWGRGILHACETAETFLHRRPVLGGAVRRSGTFLGQPAAPLSSGPPRYLRSLAREHHVEIGGHRWGLAAGGEYSSRKLLFFLFPGDGNRPEFIVKMTRSRPFNARLERECRALEQLHARGVGDDETLPRVVFSGTHGGLAIAGETIIDGVPFNRRTQATADCPFARGAVEWLTHLGEETADPLASTNDEIADGLSELLEQFGDIYKPESLEKAFLAEQIAAIAHCREPLPLVFQHGDPGRWNVFVTQSGRVAFLDWESAEPEGMPLWDSFYFLRSFAVAMGRAAGVNDALDGFKRQFLSDGPLMDLVGASTEAYCRRSGVPGRLVEPLFYTCWMHRALKEATRLSPAELSRGHYFRLLRSCIERRHSAGLTKLFA